jgi:CrcB protein
MFSNWMLVGVGGAVGALLRFSISEATPDTGFPWATLSVNLVGSLLLGLVTAATLTSALSESQALLLGVGLLGAFTTMSTFSVETITMVEAGHWGRAGAYVLASAILGPVLALAGWKSGQAIF